MKRSSLRPNPEKVREWLDKHRGKGLKRKGMPRPPRSPSAGVPRGGGTNGRAAGPRRETPLQRGKRKPRWTPPPHVRAVVLARSQGVCVACSVRRGLDPYAISSAQAYVLLHNGSVRAARELHHVLPRQRWPELIQSADNLVGVCCECHDDHERANVRIPEPAIPDCSARLAHQTGPAAFDYMVRTYPALPEPDHSARVRRVPDQE